MRFTRFVTLAAAAVLAAGCRGAAAAPEPGPSPQPPASLRELAGLVTNDAALGAFRNAALDDATWTRAAADPAAYFLASGIEIPPGIGMSLQSHRTHIPWPDRVTPLKLVVVRCWWVWSARNDDGDRVPPFRFCLEIPEALLGWVRR